MCRCHLTVVLLTKHLTQTLSTSRGTEKKGEREKDGGTEERTMSRCRSSHGNADTNPGSVPLAGACHKSDKRQPASERGRGGRLEGWREQVKQAETQVWGSPDARVYIYYIHMYTTIYSISTYGHTVCEYTFVSYRCIYCPEEITSLYFNRFFNVLHLKYT